MASTRESGRYAVVGKPGPAVTALPKPIRGQESHLTALVIIPTYNERENLKHLVRAVLGVGPAIDILIVDDNSPDGTGHLAEALAQETSRVHVLHRECKQGLGTAYIAGFQYALARDYAYVIEMDADFSHRPEDLPLLLG